MILKRTNAYSLMMPVYAEMICAARSRFSRCLSCSFSITESFINTDRRRMTQDECLSLVIRLSSAIKFLLMQLQFLHHSRGAVLRRAAGASAVIQTRRQFVR